MSRFIPPNSNRLASKVSAAVVYLYGAPDRLYAVGYVGKSEKPAFHYRFKRVEARAKWVGEWMVKQDVIAAGKIADKAAKKEALDKPHGLKVGDVLKCSWGYDQTNIDYYQVVELVGKRSVKICEIGSESVETLSMQGRSVPAVGAFIGDAMVKRVAVNDSVRIASYASAYKLEPVDVAGVKVYPSSSWTAYA